MKTHCMPHPSGPMRWLHLVPCHWTLTILPDHHSRDKFLCVCSRPSLQWEFYLTAVLEDSDAASPNRNTFKSPSPTQKMVGAMMRAMREATGRATIIHARSPTHSPSPSLISQRLWLAWAGHTDARSLTRRHAHVALIYCTNSHNWYF